MFLTVSQRCQFAKKASPLRCNRVAVMVQRQTKMAEKSPTVLRKGERLPFFRSICHCLQVLNFGNNILQFNVDAAFPFQTRMYIRVHCRVRVGIAH